MTQRELGNIKEAWDQFICLNNAAKKRKEEQREHAAA